MNLNHPASMNRIASPGFPFLLLGCALGMIDGHRSSLGAAPPGTTAGTTAVATSAGAPVPAWWRAGAASVIITPDKPMWMAGYAGRTNASQGKATELFAKALVLEDEASNRVVLVTLDLISVPRSLKNAVLGGLGGESGVTRENLLMNASHTHSGPEFRMEKGPQDWAMFGKEGLKGTKSADDYGRELKGKVVEVIHRALTNRAPSRISYQHARCSFAMNRRTPVGTNYQNFPNPEGPVDPDVPVLKVEGPDGRLRAVLFGYACHNTTLPLYQICGDYAGYAQLDLEKAHPGIVALFMQGCGGDQNPYPRGTYELAAAHGRTLATAVEAALQTRALPLSAPLRLAYGEVDIDYAPPPTREECEAQLQSTDRFVALHAQRMLERMKDHDGRLPQRYPFPAQVIRFGRELTFVGLAGETCVDYSLRLKRELGGEGAVWVAGYCNDVMAYIPSARLLAEGGYEPHSSMTYSEIHPGPWAPTLEEKIHGLVRQLRQRVTAP